MFDNREQHPAYGMLAFHRVSGGDPNLFGSSVKHNNKIQLTLKEGYVIRELNNDWYNGGKTLFEVEMSYTQFAELISAMNIGDGIPVTIRYTTQKGRIEGIQTVNRRTQFMNEFEEKNGQSAEDVQNIINKLKTIFAEKRPIRAKEREEILSTLRSLSMAVESHNSFMISQFDEAMEKICTEAKGEVEAFIQNKMHSLALAALNEKEQLKETIDVPLIPDET